MAAYDAHPKGVNGDTTSPQKTITVLVTGFEPFQDRYPINPSFEITKLLPETITTDKVQINIVRYEQPIRVCYDAVRELVPVLHKSYAGTVDMVLHMGMASGRDFYTCEIYGHRDGYHRNKDLDGKTLPADHGLRHFSDCPSVMTSSLDVGGVIEGWRSNVRCVPDWSHGSEADCRPSDDAGHYLCDYIYFNSLAWFGRRNEKVVGGKAQDRPVLFLHVPADSDLGALEKGRVVTIALIEAMVDSWVNVEEA